MIDCEAGQVVVVGEYGVCVWIWLLAGVLITSGDVGINYTVCVCPDQPRHLRATRRLAGGGRGRGERLLDLHNQTTAHITSTHTQQTTHNTRNYELRCRWRRREKMEGKPADLAPNLVFIGCESHVCVHLCSHGHCHRHSNATQPTHVCLLPPRQVSSPSTFFRYVFVPAEGIAVMHH